MCGIAGFIGESKNKNITFDLTTKLFSKSESRGTDAAGFWASDSSGVVYYHKEPIRSSQFIKNELWLHASRANVNLMLTHARGASKGFGEPYRNINNHPFVSSGKSLALVHNGRIEDHEYNALKEKYEVCSGCDSEILLRILESREESEDFSDLGNLENLHRMAGIKDIYSLINDGHMAVAVGERLEDGTRLLWLFRNKHRPLWISDMRESLGQIFFVSEPSIWEDSVSEMKSNRFFKRQKLIEIPEEEVWYIKLHQKTLSTSRLEVCKDDCRCPWEFDGVRKSIVNKSYTHKVMTKLGPNDEVTHNDKNGIWNEPPPSKTKTLEGHQDIEEFSLRDLAYKCKTLKDIIDSIETTATDLTQQQSITRHDFDELLSLLNSQKDELQNIESNLNNGY